MIIICIDVNLYLSIFLLIYTTKGIMDFCFRYMLKRDLIKKKHRTTTIILKKKIIINKDCKGAFKK